MSLIIPVILCGGSGTRLWPLSRENMPKQFVSLTEVRSPFQQALLRVTDPGLFAKPIVVTHTDFRFTVAEQSQNVGVSPTILLEPCGRDSGPAIAAASEFALSQAVDPILLVLAADHVIPDETQFREACANALASAKAGRIVTFGIHPTYAAASYGYIRPGTANSGQATFEVISFIEKPDASTAVKLIDEGCLWNSGNFLFRADILLAELEKFEPDIRSGAKAAIVNASSDLDFIRIEASEFAKVPRKSIDYAVLEKTALACVLPVDYRWSDIGSWNAVWSISAHDARGNAVDGPVELVLSENCFVHSDEGILTTIIGLKDTIVISTKDAVLVTDHAHAEMVKDLVATLKRKGHTQATEHVRVYRPWGYYQRADAGPRYQVKRISVKPGGQLSLQRHHHRSEHWIVVRGTAQVIIDERASMIHENESIYIPIGAIHRLTNPGRIDLELIEVQVGSYLGEDDIVRLEDVYRRHPAQP